MGGYELKTRLISTRVVPLFLFLSQARTSTGSRLITLKTQKKRHRYLVFYHSLRSLLCRLTVIYSFFYFLVSFHSATSKKFNINLFVIFFPISYRKKTFIISDPLLHSPFRQLQLYVWFSPLRLGSLRSLLPGFRCFLLLRYVLFTLRILNRSL